ncbi:hypothetical protein BDV93DRAFT_605123 [Ceratobasidium sp. AG-I]|nr:hypothetical protein BDV93DRAFT_605123 [Ceratobasidium sp. AG-I]
MAPERRETRGRTMTLMDGIRRDFGNYKAMRRLETSHLDQLSLLRVKPTPFTRPKASKRNAPTEPNVAQSTSNTAGPSGNRDRPAEPIAPSHHGLKMPDFFKKSATTTGAPLQSKAVIRNQPSVPMKALCRDLEKTIAPSKGKENPGRVGAGRK